MEKMRWFRDRGHELFLATPEDSAINRAARNENFEIAQLDFTKGTTPLDVIRLGGFIKKIKPDIIGTHSSVDSWVGLVSAYLKGVRWPIDRFLQRNSQFSRMGLVGSLLCIRRDTTSVRAEVTSCDRIWASLWYPILQLDLSLQKRLKSKRNSRPE